MLEYFLIVITYRCYDIPLIIEGDLDWMNDFFTAFQGVGHESPEVLVNIVMAGPIM